MILRRLFKKGRLVTLRSEEGLHEGPVTWAVGEEAEEDRGPGHGGWGLPS